MKRIALHLLLAGALLSLGACGGQEGPAAGIPVELEEAIDLFYAAIEAGDDEARIEMFTEDALMLPNHWTPYEGREAVAEVIRSGAGSVFRIRNRQVLDMAVDGDLAYVVNAYEYTWHAEGGTPRWKKTKNVHVWKFDVGGHWRLHLDIWNSDVPLDEYANE